MNKREWIANYRSGVCDKCQKPVSQENSALLLHEIATDRFAGFVRDRHLYPTGDCEGSPGHVRLVETDSTWLAAYDLVTSVCDESPES